MHKFLNSWTGKIVLAGVLLYFISRGGGAVFGTVLRFAIPAIVVYSGYRIVRNFFMLPTQAPVDRSQSHRSQTNSDTTIEICATCGHEKGNPHCDACRE